MQQKDLIDYAPPECLGEGFDLEWHMTRAERIILMHLLQKFRPEVALEVGTYRGGSLQAISRHSGDVVTVDIDPKIPSLLAGRFSNVAFETGDSTQLLPTLVERLSSELLGFVLIDGSHQEKFVRHDINAVLKIVPRRPIAMVMHDSFMPACRAGIRGAEWAACPYVHYVELDFVSGCFLPRFNSVGSSMVGGFAFALLKPEPRVGELEIYESQKQQFEVLRRYSEKAGAARWSTARRVARHVRNLIC
jgi:hypothetical protein